MSNSNFTSRINALEKEWRHAAGRVHEAEAAHHAAKKRVEELISAAPYRLGDARLAVRESLEALEAYTAAVRTEADAWIRLDDERTRVRRLTAAQRKAELGTDPVFQARTAEPCGHFRRSQTP